MFSPRGSLGRRAGTGCGRVRISRSDRGSLSLREQHKKSPSSQLKTMYKSPKGKEPVWNPDWKDMSCLDLSNDPFQRVQDELDRVQSHYSKMEIVIRGASKLLGDCKARNICK